MALNQTEIRAIRTLRHRVRFRSASLQLPGTPFPKDDTPAIREAVRLYTESWILPILDALERGDTRDLAEMSASIARQDRIDTDWDGNPNNPKPGA